MKQPESCKEFCTQKSNHLASTVIEGDYRCHVMEGKAYDRGQKLGYCDDWTKTTGNKPRHPDPEKCQAEIDKAREECKKLPKDPSQMDRPVSGSATYKGGRPVRINGKPVVIKGEACICDKKQTTPEKESKSSLGTTIR